MGNRTVSHLMTTINISKRWINRLIHGLVDWLSVDWLIDSSFQTTMHSPINSFIHWVFIVIHVIRRLNISFICSFINIFSHSVIQPFNHSIAHSLVSHHLAEWLTYTLIDYLWLMAEWSDYPNTSPEFPRLPRQLAYFSTSTAELSPNEVFSRADWGILQLKANGQSRYATYRSINPHLLLP